MDTNIRYSDLKYAHLINAYFTGSYLLRAYLAGDDLTVVSNLPISIEEAKKRGLII